MLNCTCQKLEKLVYHFFYSYFPPYRLRDGEFERPRNGKHNDKAHPPIHPTAFDGSLTGGRKKVYEFIVRRFLGSCWKNATGQETTVEVKMGTEYFDAKGLVIRERNYLEVYIYDKWTGNEIPEFRVNTSFVPDTLLMESGQTTPPKYLTESDLISLMEKNEIGTDATIAEHIQKVMDRDYMYKDGQYIKPLTLGIALILGYDQIGLDSSLSKPFLRKQMEADLKSICLGTIAPSEVKSRSIHKYREMFERLKLDFTIVRNSMDTYFREDQDVLLAANNTPSTGLFGENNHNGRGRGRGSRGGGSNRGRGANEGDGRGSTGGNSNTRGTATRGRGRGGNNTSTNNHSNNNNSDTDTPFCRCSQRSVERTVTRAESPNRGRKFYTCPNGRDNSCNFFEWVDDN
jgi:DNA topoisomerase-3